MGYVDGFWVTLKQIFSERVTSEYPKEKRPKPLRLHGRHVLNRYEDGMEKCIVYEINYLRCIHCDLCVEACPTEAITESKVFEFSFTNRADAIYTRSELVVGEDGRPQKLPWEDWREGDDQHTSAWMRATSPNGSAAYEGRVSWSGELGYGVRAAEVGQSNDPDLVPPRDVKPERGPLYRGGDSAPGERTSDHAPEGARAAGSGGGGPRP